MPDDVRAWNFVDTVGRNSANDCCIGDFWVLEKDSFKFGWGNLPAGDDFSVSRAIGLGDMLNYLPFDFDEFLGSTNDVDLASLQATDVARPEPFLLALSKVHVAVAKHHSTRANM